MLHFSYSSNIGIPAPDVYAWHTRPGAFERLVPPWTDVRLIQAEGIRNGAISRFTLEAGPISIDWTADHRDVIAGSQFRDIQRKGPFRHWEHLHRMIPDSPSSCLLVDEITCEPPLKIASKSLVRREIDRMFAYRHRTTSHDTERHARYNLKPLRIAMTGASGMLGSNLTAFLTAGGHQVLPVVRNKNKVNAGSIYWNPERGEIEAAKLEQLDAVIHLAGENLFALRWTEAKKNRIYTSRTVGTHLLSETLARLNQPPGVFVSVAATGIYGDRANEVLNETAPVFDQGFLANVCRAWEAATDPARSAGIRTVNFRLGIVLSPRGGALKVMRRPYLFAAGGPLGNGNQYISWVAPDDAFAAFLHVLSDSTLEGPVNLVSPEPVRMDTFARTLGRVMSRPAWFRVPSFVLKTVMGQVADETILFSQRVVPEILTRSGFHFRYPRLEDALSHQLGTNLDLA